MNTSELVREDHLMAISNGAAITRERSTGTLGFHLRGVAITDEYEIVADYRR